MSAGIDVELKGRNVDTDVTVDVLLSGETDSTTCWLEINDEVIELSVKELQAAIAYAEFIDG